MYLECSIFFICSVGLEVQRKFDAVKPIDRNGEETTLGAEVGRFHVVPRERVLHAETYPQVLGRNGSGPFARQRIAQLDILQTQVGAVVEEELAGLVVGILLRR